MGSYAIASWCVDGEVSPCYRRVLYGELKISPNGRFSSGQIRVNRYVTGGVCNVRLWHNRSYWLVFCFSSDVYICGVGLWSMDKQPRSDIGWFPHVLRLFSTRYGSVCSRHEPLESDTIIFLRVIIITAAATIISVTTSFIFIYVTKNSYHLRIIN